jgi:hypothetical protein
MPPVYLIYSARPAIGDEQRDPTHTSNFGVKLQEHCQATGIDCQLVYPEAPNVQFPTPTEYLIATLKAKHEPVLKHGPNTACGGKAR